MTNVILTVSFCIVVLQFFVIYSFSTRILVEPGDQGGQCFNESCGLEFNPRNPLVNCTFLPQDFLKCQDEPDDLAGNATAKQENGFGCVKFGGQRYEDVERSRVWCEVLPGIECYGERRFLSVQEYPCIKYRGHYFVTTLIYSVLLGFLGMDRFCLGHTGSAVGKLLTLGGAGVWWIVDVVLLVTGELRPADDSSWMPYY